MFRSRRLARDDLHVVAAGGVGEGINRVETDSLKVLLGPLADEEVLVAQRFDQMLDLLFGRPRSLRRLRGIRRTSAECESEEQDRMTKKPKYWNPVAPRHLR